MAKKATTPTTVTLKHLAAAIAKGPGTKAGTWR